ncbi:MAG TPA: pilus assembly protein PilM [Sedimentisphaerales bacterium]|nr:pilus assembly protein PilM [Sedimentisphaerales bacterium]
MKRYDVIGVDIGSSAVKIVELRKESGGWAVRSAGMAEIDRGDEQEAANEANAAEAVTECLRSSGAESRLAVCSVAGPEVAVRNFSFPTLHKDEIEGAVMLEASQVCPFEIDRCAVSYQLIPNSENKLSGVLVAATNKLIERKKRCVAGGSLDAVLMDVDGLALLNCFTELEGVEPERTIALLNLGRSYANLAIMGRDSLPFVRDIACSTNGAGVQGWAEQHQDPASWQDAFPRLTADVNDTLRYYAARAKTGVVEQILVCGGFALLEGFVQWLNGRLTAQAVLWNPFEKMPCRGGHDCSELLQTRGPVMAVAAGLAMRAV